LLVDEFGGNRFRQTGEKNGDASSVGPLLTDPESRPNNEIINLPSLYLAPLKKLRYEGAEKLVSPPLAKPIPGWITGSGP
jgi:hypothetical protein